MEPFEFHAELFEVRNEVLELLADCGFAWLSDFGFIDLMHDIYGIEVCGILRQEDAQAIEAVLLKTYSSWRHSRMYCKDASTHLPSRAGRSGDLARSRELRRRLASA